MDFPYGTLITTPPPGLLPPEVWPEYEALALPRPPCKREMVGSDPSGVRWGVWPIYFEEYISDTEPDLSAAEHGPLAYNRAIAWKRIARRDIPAGWHELSTQAWRIDGFAELLAGVDYRAAWHAQTRRNLRLWEKRHKDTTHRIEPIGMEEYRAAYQKSTVRKKIGNDALAILERKHAVMRNTEHRKTWGVRNIQSGEIIAGLSLCHSPTFNSSAYESPFILPEARHTFAMTALIDHWYQESMQRGTRYQVYNAFWQPGSPRDWKNFSAFKSQFSPTCIAYPPTLWRFKAGKFF